MLSEASTSCHGHSLLERSHDGALINQLVNHPEIRPFIGGEGPVDLSEAALRPENWFLLGEHGGFALIWSAPGIHEVHTFILMSGRGPWARQAAADGIHFASRHGDTMLWTKIPHDQPNVRAFAAAMGMADAGLEIETLGKPYRVFMMEVPPCQQQQ